MPDPISLGLAGGSALAGLIGNLTRKKNPARPGKFHRLNTGTDQQNAGRNEALQMALSGLRNPTQGFQPIADEAKRQFEEEGLPSLAERFTAMGNGAQRSSAFAGTAGAARTGLDSQLASLKAQYGLQNQNSLQHLLGLGLQPQFENYYQPGTEEYSEQTPLSGALGGLSQGLAGLSQSYGFGDALGARRQSQGAAETEQGLRSQPQEQSFGDFVGHNFKGYGAAPFSKVNTRVTLPNRVQQPAGGFNNENFSGLAGRVGQRTGGSTTYGGAPQAAYDYAPNNASQTSQQNFADFLQKYLSGVK